MINEQSAKRSALKGRVFKIQIQSSLAAAPLQRRIAAGSHNRLLRRQHCSSLCSQSEGHEHVANMANALGHDFVVFSARAWPPQYSSPSLCEQSELQCFALELRQMSAHRPFQLCRNCHVIGLKTAQRLFLDFERPTLQGRYRLSTQAAPH